MIFNKIEWPKCPYCECLINDWHAIPAQAIMGDGRYGFEMKCPTAYAAKEKCDKTFLVWVNKSISFETDRLEESK